MQCTAVVGDRGRETSAASGSFRPVARQVHASGRAVNEISQVDVGRGVSIVDNKIRIVAREHHELPIRRNRAE